MKGIFRILSIVILLAALAGAIVLVRKNQETRRGATANETSSQILPSVINTASGGTFEAQVWVNTGKDTDMLAGVEIKIPFNSQQLRFEGATAKNGYQLLTGDTPGELVTTDTSGNATISLKMIAMGAEKAGAINVANLKFTSLQDGGGSLVAQQGKLAITGQTATWDVASYSPANYKTGSGGDKPCGSNADCAANEYCDKSQPPCPAGNCPILSAGVCRLKPDNTTPTPTPIYCVNGTCPAGYSCLNVDCPIGQTGSMCGKSICTKVTNPTPTPIYCVNGVCPAGYKCISAISQCTLGMICPNSIPKPVCVKIPTVTPTTTAVRCGWCGTTCQNLNVKTFAACPTTAPPADKKCVNVGGVCRVVATVTVVPTKVPGGSCGQRCGGTTGLNCATGLRCIPIWWPCASLPVAVDTQLQKNVAISRDTVTSLVKTCPALNTLIPTGTQTGTTVKFPTYYGVCRNPLCTNDTDCKCATNITPTKVPTNVPTPIISAQEALLSLQFEQTTVSEGDEVLLQLAVDTASQNKVSAVSTKINLGGNFDVADVQWEGRGTEVKKEIDNTNGMLTLYYVWNLPAERLYNRYTVATIKLAAKKAGTFTVDFVNTGFNNEVSGLDANGNSIGFVISTVNSGSLTVNPGLTCKQCNNGNGKGKALGNANCDEDVNSVDFEVWRSEVFDQDGLSGTEKSDWNADFNCDKKVSGADFEIWRSTVFQ